MWHVFYRAWKRKYRLAKRKPWFLLRYLLLTAAFRMAGFLVYLLAALLPALPLPDFMNWRMTDVLRQFQRLDVTALRPLFQESLARVRLGLSLDNLLRLVASLPMELKKLVSRLVDAVRTQRRAFWAFLRSLWPPAQAGRRLRVLAKRHFRNVRRLTRAVITFVLTLLILKFVLLVVIPFIVSVGILSFLGFDAMVVLIALGHAFASLASNFLGKRIHRRLHGTLPGAGARRLRRLRCKVRKYTVGLFFVCLRRALRSLERRRLEEFRKSQEYVYLPGRQRRGGTDAK